MVEQSIRIALAGAVPITRALVDVADVLAGREHGDHRLGVGHRLGGRAGARAAAGLGPAQRVLDEIEGAHLVPRLGEVRGHAAAHIAEPDEGYPCHCLPLSSSQRKLESMCFLSEPQLRSQPSLG